MATELLVVAPRSSRTSKKLIEGSDPSEISIIISSTSVSTFLLKVWGYTLILKLCSGTISSKVQELPHGVSWPNSEWQEKVFEVYHCEIEAGAPLAGARYEKNFAEVQDSQSCSGIFARRGSQRKIWELASFILLVNHLHYWHWILRLYHSSCSETAWCCPENQRNSKVRHGSDQGICSVSSPAWTRSK